MRARPPAPTVHAVFIVASSGRCGTLALCEALDRFSDHRVEHEPPPRLLEEAREKHLGRPYETRTLSRRLDFFARRSRSRYGQSFRAVTLLPEVGDAAPEARFLVLVREPAGYLLSAHAKHVLRKGDEWDRFRIMPRTMPADATIADRLALHWVAVNTYLLEFAESTGDRARVALVGRLEDDVEEWAEFLGVKILDREQLAGLLATRPNAAATGDQPDGYDGGAVSGITSELWDRARKLAT